MSLFALPFAAVGVFMLGWVGKNGLDAWQMRGWQPVQAQVVNAGYETHSGDDGATYKAYATYHYAWYGQPFTGDRVGIDDMADNIGDYQQEMAARLSSAQRNGAPITVYVDPEQPWESIVDRKLRWGMVGFKLIFGLVFGGVGFGLLYATFRAPKEKDEGDPAYTGKPWLLNDDWQSDTVRSDSRGAMIGAWIFAAIWNLISTPTPFLAYREFQSGNYIALVALLFPLVGIGLLYWAITRTLEWRRFGPAPLTLDPFPGSIGGHVGGTIELNQPLDSQAKYQLTLTAINSYISGSGKNRSRKEKAKWQDKLVAHAESTGTGTRLSFRFDVPAGLAESDARQEGDDYSLWRLNLHAEQAGPDIDRDYEIPVYATAQQSRRLSEHVVRQARSEQNAIDDAAVLTAVELSSDVHGKRMYFPMGRHLGASFVGLLFGAIFGGAGWFLVVEEGATIFGSVFALVGILIGLVSLYMACNSLEVSQDGTSIRTVRRVLGIPVKRSEMHRNAFERFYKNSSMQSQSGRKTVMYYTVYALDKIGNKMVVGEGFKGDNEANAAMRLLAREFGLGDVLAANS